MMRDLSSWNLLKWVWLGKTMTRAMLNIRLSAIPPLRGVTLDLGGGAGASYKGLVTINGMFVNMDARVEARPTVVGDLEATFPFKSESADAVLLFNTLEHVFGYQHVVSEMCRVLKKGGQAFIYTPFIFPIHTHQTEKFFVDDYFRYTDSTLRNVFSTAGFSRVEIQAQGGLFIVIAEFLGFAVKFGPVRLIAAAWCLVLEKIYRYLRPGASAERYPLAYFVVATK